jgi:hypothetical protein
LSPNEPMAIVQADVQMERPLPLPVASIPDGKYVIKNRAANYYWSSFHKSTSTVYFWYTTTPVEEAKLYSNFQVNKNYNNFQVNKNFLIIQVFRG